MEDNKLLMIVLAFVLGCMASQMMKNMCGGRLVEGVESTNCIEIINQPRVSTDELLNLTGGPVTYNKKGMINELAYRTDRLKDYLLCDHNSKQNF